MLAFKFKTEDLPLAAGIKPAPTCRQSAFRSSASSALPAVPALSRDAIAVWAAKFSNAFPHLGSSTNFSGGSSLGDVRSGVSADNCADETN